MAQRESIDSASLPRATDHKALETEEEGDINEHAKTLSEHHDRIRVCEERLGIHKGVDNFGGKDHDQAGLVKGDPAKHDKYPKKDQSELYKRKRHS